MSTRFYPRQTDYIVQLNALDDAAQLAITKGDLAAKWATQTTGEVVAGQGYSAYYYANQAGQTLATTNTAVALAQAWASQASGVVNGTAFYSANYYATQSGTSATLAQNWATSMVNTFTGAGGLYGAKYYATDAQTSATTAKNWATQATTEVVAGQGYSAKQYATNASGSATSAQNWATQLTTEVVNGQGYSAKQYAVNASGSATLAQNWASQTTGVVNGTAYYSAYYYSLQAKGSSDAAAQALIDTNAAKGAAQTAQTAAQNWATQASGEVVVGQGYSAKYSATAAANSATLAQAWASQAAGVVNGTALYSAAYYAKQAADSAAVATAGQIPSDWNQVTTTAKDYIKNKPDFSAMLAGFGIGNISAAPLLTTMDDSTSGAGMYYVNNATTGTWPAGLAATGGFVLHKVYGTAGFQMLQPYGLNRIFYRWRSGSTWGAWNEMASTAMVPALARTALSVGGAGTTGAVTYDNTSGVLTVQSLPVVYQVPFNSSSTGWVKFGTFTVPNQGGQILRLVVTGHSGYNSTPLQNQETVLVFKTANGSSFDGNGFSGDGSWYTTGATGYGNISITGIKVKADAAGAGARNYEVWVNQGAFMDNSIYEVTVSSGCTWTNNSPAAVGQADPGVASSTICVPLLTVPSFNGQTLLHNGNYGTVALPLTGGTLTGNIWMQSAAPALHFMETDQAGIPGKWRLVADAGQFRIDRNTDAGGNYASTVADFKIGTDGLVSIPRLSVATSVAIPDRNADDNSQFAANTKYVDASVATRAMLTGANFTGVVASNSAIQARSGLDGEVMIGADPTNGGIEIGKINRGTAGSPFIDFHSSVNSPDFDVRLQTTGGSAASGNGTLNVQAASLQVNASPVMTANQKDASGGFAGLTGFALNLKNAAGSILSNLVSAATAARTWTFPDKDGTVAMLSDIPTAGGAVLLASYTVSTAVTNLDFLSIFSAAYDKYIIEIEGVQPSALDQLLFLLATGGVVSGGPYYTATSSYSTQQTSFGSFFGLNPINTPTTGWSTMTVEVGNVNAASPTTLFAHGTAGSNSGMAGLVINGAHTTATAMSGFRVYWFSGANFTKGTVRVFGLKNT